MSRPIDHGMSHSREYCTWAHMKERCDNPNHHAYNNYGGRGITYCDEWSSFTNFYIDMGERPEGKSLDRIDNDGDYCYDNCRWSTDLEQENNRRFPSKRKTNTSGVIGVSFHSKHNKWRARARNLELYRGDSYEEAVKARKEWERINV